MDKEEVIVKAIKYSELVIPYLKPKMIVLYGSYSKNSAKEDSDIDIAVICDSIGDDYLEKAHNLFKLRRRVDLRIEPVLIDQINDKSGFCEEIMKTGTIIHNRKV